MRLKKRAALVSIFVLFAVGSGILADADSATKVALVAFSVNDYGDMLESGSGADAAGLVEENMRRMVTLGEESLAQHWTVVSAESFVANEAYRELSIGRIKDGLFGAEFNGQVLPSFTVDRKQIIKCVLEKATAKKLCAILGVDVVVVVYSEWAVATGRFAPTNKALTKNCVAAYNSSGKQLFYGRKDVQGKMTLGAMGSFTLDENTINEWVWSYKEGFDAVLAKFGKKVK